MTDATNHLTTAGIRPSVQRIAVMKYLLEHRTHPTVDDIYMHLQQQMPTLSRTTVYNTIELLVAKGAALELTIDGHTTHYDGYTAPHAHHRCSCCGRITDVEITPESLSELTNACPLPCSDMQVFYTGLCTECARKGAN